MPHHQPPFLNLDLLNSLSAEPRVELDSSRNEPMTIDERLRSRRAWETVLVHQTLNYVKENVPFYRDLVVRDFDSLSWMQRHPILTKPEIEASPDAFLSRSVAVTSVRCTSGTMTRRLVVYGCEEERLARAQLATIKKPPSTEPANLVLRLFAQSKRLLPPPPTPGMPQLTAIYPHEIIRPADRYDYEDMIVELLWGEYPLAGTKHRITVLHATPACLALLLTSHLLERGVDLSHSWVRTIAVTGTYLPSTWRKRLAESWNASVATSYSCTEVLSEARECPVRPGVFHFDETVYAEVVDPKTHMPTEPGQHGVLLLTSLYPFHQAMPFLRYDTQDIVERIDPPCKCGSVSQSIRPLGRRAHCLDLSPVAGKSVYLGSVDLEEILTRFPEVPHIHYPRFLARLESSSKNGVSVVVDVEVYHRPWEEAPTLKSRIEDEIRARLTELVPDRTIPVQVNPLKRGASDSYTQLLR